MKKHKKKWFKFAKKNSVILFASTQRPDMKKNKSGGVALFC